MMRILLILLISCCAKASQREVVVGGPCEGCEHAFEGQPATLASSARIAPANEPGEALSIDGVVRDAAKQPVAGVIVYAYQTNAKGLYPAGTTRHGALRGFAITDATGAYHFDTIRPASYPDSDLPQHVHLHVLERGRCTYYVDDLMFTDDPLLTPAQRATQTQRGGTGIATPVKDEATWRVRRDITLGAGIRDYDRCR